MKRNPVSFDILTVVVLISTYLLCSASDAQDLGTTQKIVAMTTRPTISVAMFQTVFKNTLSIGGTEMITLRGDSQASVDNRADILTNRINYILGEPNLTADDIVIVMEKNDPVLYVRKHLLVTVTTQDAAYNQLTQEKQADIWLQKFRETLPELSTKR
jgi:hypothetical protein